MISVRNGHGDAFETKAVRTEALALHLPRRACVRLLAQPSVPVDLPVDPYVFGYWLGDGQSANGNICVGMQDYEHLRAELIKTLRAYEDLGEAHYWQNMMMLNIRRRPELCPKGHDRTDNPRFSKAGHPICRRCTNGKAKHLPTLMSLHERLKSVGVIKNKHIPDLYLHAGTHQRRALLQGLMDSDGHIDKAGRAGFTNTNRRIVDGFVFVARSLGYKPQVRQHNTSGWIVSFAVNSTAPIVRLERKAARVVVATSRQARMKYIRSVTELTPDGHDQSPIFRSVLEL
ncbi:LAGLIDADG family homing endonuclease [Pseudarthrobacter sp. WHRI 8279]|uniref:LAGLIDADG family homing endonuclease n=1 Tax=Pseudarthrobacter sp. WHRI 8279 TaxID=3162566 RepID=UPI0032ED6C12